jgi:hypothetical protein
MRLVATSLTLVTYAIPASALVPCASVVPDAAYTGVGCHGECSLTGTTYECDLTTLGCGAMVGAEAWMINLSNPYETSAYGQ